MSVQITVKAKPQNTQYAPLAVLGHYYQQQGMLEPLQNMVLPGKVRDFAPQDKLLQILVSMLAGCTTLSEVNPRLKHEATLAQSWGWPRIADQSTLSRSLDQLTLKQIKALRASTTAIWRSHSQIQEHDWRAHLWLEFDLSGLPCSAHAEASQKGYFADKKTPLDAN